MLTVTPLTARISAESHLSEFTRWWQQTRRKNIWNEENTATYHGPTLLRKSSSFVEVFIQIYEPIQLKPSSHFCRHFEKTVLHTVYNSPYDDHWHIAEIFPISLCSSPSFPFSFISSAEIPTRKHFKLSWTDEITDGYKWGKKRKKLKRYFRWISNGYLSVVSCQFLNPIPDLPVT